MGKKKEWSFWFPSWCLPHLRDLLLPRKWCGLGLTSRDPAMFRANMFSEDLTKIWQ